MLDASEHRIGSRLLIVPKVISASVLYRVERARIRSYVSKSLTKASAASGVLEKHERDLRASVQRYVTRRLSAARRVAEFETCAKLFGLWHVLHVPLFFMLLIAGIVHVLAVNIY